MEPSLRLLYGEALGTLAALRARSGVLEVRVQHVYREHNTDADGVCNEVLDRVMAGMPALVGSCHVSVGWRP